MPRNLDLHGNAPDNLPEQAKQAKVSIICVKDNFGKWQSNFNNLVEHSTHEKVRGSKIAGTLKHL